MTFLVSIETTCFFLLVPNGVLWDYWVEVKAETWPRVLFAKTFDLLRHFNLGTKIKLRSLKRSSRKKWEKEEEQFSMIFRQDATPQQISKQPTRQFLQTLIRNYPLPSLDRVLCAQVPSHTVAHSGLNNRFFQKLLIIEKIQAATKQRKKQYFTQ